MSETIHLRIREPDGSVREVPAVEGLTLGRSSSNRIVIADVNVSSEHARLVLDADGALAIEDLGSANKVRFEDGPILGKGDRHRLIPGERFSLGRTVIEIVGTDEKRLAVDRTELVELNATHTGETTQETRPTPKSKPADQAAKPAAKEDPPAKEVEVAKEADAPKKEAPKKKKKAPPLPEIPPLPEGTLEPKAFTLNRYTVDLSTYSVRHEAITCHDVEDVLGGAARGFKILQDFSVEDPYSPEAPLILNLGRLSGSQFMTGLRTYFHGFSPLKCTNSYRPSAMWTAGSGKFGTKIRYMDIDEVIFTGRAVMPVYLHISEGEDGKPEFRFKNASQLVGKRANEKIQHLHTLYPDAHFAVIGPAGENYRGVRFASIALSTINQLRSGDMKSRFCGRGGFGGVMGSKNLLAIAADVKDKKRGDKVPGLKEVNQHVARGKGSQRFRDARKGDGGGGTWANMTSLNPLHAMPEYNFNPTGTDISVPLYRENVEKDGRFVIKDEACFACGIACHKNMYDKGPDGKPSKFRAKFDYEPLNLLSANIGIFDIDQAAELVDMVDDLCMDSISVGVTLAYAMEYNKRVEEKGEESILPEYIRYGDFEGARRALEEIGRGELPLLGQGAKRLSEALGETGYAMHCKGVEFPAYLPQFNPGYPWALAGGHMSMRTYLLYVFEREKGMDYWVEAITERGFSILRDDILGICKFSGLPDDVMAHTVAAMTGLEIDPETLKRCVLRTFLRGYRLEKDAGFTSDDYAMPSEVHQEYPQIDLEHFNSREFFEALKDKVTARFDQMLIEQGL
ncbi:MAG TPA: FHA domain-containing protein [Planctomycetes bacterium]|nr:FHA domain-containing protein [Planctomycetota bacterium]